jgi:hypothetical protein
MPFPNQNNSKRDCHHRESGVGFEKVEQARGIEPPILTLEKGHVLTLNYTRIRLKKSAVTQRDKLYLRATINTRYCVTAFNFQKCYQF